MKKSQRLKLEYWILGISVLVLILVFCASRPRIVNTNESIEQLTDVAKLIAVMQDHKIKKTVIHGIPQDFLHYKVDEEVNLSDSGRNEEFIMKALAEFPNKIDYVCSINPQDVDAVEQVDYCDDNGAVGVKVYLGYSYAHQSPLDNPFFDDFYAEVDDRELILFMPVNLSGYQEEFENVLAAHPSLTVVAPHYGLSSKNLERIGGLLDTYPNLYIDTSFGHIDFVGQGFKTISDNVTEFKAFFETYQDRILFGTNNVVTTYEGKKARWVSELSQDYINLLTKDRFTSIVVPGEDSADYQEFNGLNLPKSIQAKVFWRNWNKLLE